MATGTLVVLWQGERRSGNQAWSMARDWAPLALLLLGFRELDWFTVLQHTPVLERMWQRWDEFFLAHLRVSAFSGGTFPIIPTYLELCYLLVYGTGAACITFLYVTHRRARVDRWLVTYLTGTLAAYGLIPFFPSLPPWILFPGSGAGTNIFREVNLWILRGATIHSGVFPSAHVSSAFSAAWGMFQAAPEHRRFAWFLVIYATSVALATVYGRYHYGVDAVAGFGISVVAGIATKYLFAGPGETGQSAH